jgi:GAF domain-containing protein
MTGITLDGAAICRRLDELDALGANLAVLLASAVEQLHTGHAAFHWTGIYELFADRMLRLGPYIGAPTDHVEIPVGRGVCGSAVSEAKDKNIADVRQEANYLACSTATRSELVVLIRRGDEIFAQIDIDSHDVDAFDARTEAEVKQVADWLAGAYSRHRK